MPSKGRRPRSTSQYYKNRAALLKDQPMCHWCKTRRATEADHLIELDRGGSNEPDNLVPACKRCNATRGAKYKAAKQRARRRPGQSVKQPTKQNAKRKPFLDSKREMTPRPLFRIPEGNQPEQAGTGRSVPRLETAVPDGVESRAAEIGEIAKQHLGVDLMAWQLRALHGLTALKDDGKFLHRTGLISTARQNGKTVALAAFVLWALTKEAARRGPVTVLTTAHRLDVAVELFHRLADILEVQFGAKAMRAYGRNEVKMPDGSRWLIKAATPSVGHGLSVDFVICDEVWDVSPEAIDQGLVPTMRARPNPLFAMWSTAGTEASTVFQRYREQGLRQIDQGETGKFYFAEWSPPPDLDPMTPAAWEYANPALGTTLELETLEAEAESPDRAAFLRSSVNLWVATDRSWVPPGVWPQLHHTGDVPAGGIVAVETSVDDSRYFGVRCVGLPDGRVCATVAFHVDTIAQALDEIRKLAKDGKIKFAVTPTIDLHFPRELEARKVVVGYGELLKWTVAVRQLIDQGRLVHTGETMLAEHVQRAVAVRTQSAVALSSQRSPGPIELARCMVWAAALASRSTASGKPMIVVAGG